MGSQRMQRLVHGHLVQAHRRLRVYFRFFRIIEEFTPIVFERVGLVVRPQVVRVSVRWRRLFFRLGGLGLQLFRPKGFQV